MLSFEGKRIDVGANKLKLRRFEIRAFCDKTRSFCTISASTFWKVQPDIHTYIHVHSYVHTYTHTYIRTYIHTYIHTYIQTYTNIHTHIHKNIHIYIHVGTNIYTYIRLLLLVRRMPSLQLFTAYTIMCTGHFSIQL